MGSLLGSKYIPYTYMEPLGEGSWLEVKASGLRVQGATGSSI